MASRSSGPAHLGDATYIGELYLLTKNTLEPYATYKNQSDFEIIYMHIRGYAFLSSLITKIYFFGDKVLDLISDDQVLDVCIVDLHFGSTFYR